MKILITGASGFIGGSLMRRFGSTPGVQLFGVGRRPTPLENYRQVDLAEDFELPFDPDVVVHCAALSSPWATRGEYRKHNVLVTRNVIRFCEEHGRPKLVYVSSSSVFYRPEDQLNLTENSPIGPNFISEYAATKYEGEKALGEYLGATVILRPRAVFGPGDTVLFPRILVAARQGKLPLLTRSGPKAQGDLIYIDSLCDYIFLAATRPDVVGSYNLTNGETVVIQDFLANALCRLGISPPTRKVSVKAAMLAAFVTEWAHRLLRLSGEPPITRFGVSVFAYSKTFDVTRALKDLGPPSVSLAEGIDKFVIWQKTFL